MSLPEGGGGGGGGSGQFKRQQFISKSLVFALLFDFADNNTDFVREMVFFFRAFQIFFKVYKVLSFVSILTLTTVCCGSNLANTPLELGL